jgi:hypothetical protein
MLKKSLMKTRTLALAAGVTAALLLGDGVAQAQSGSAGSSYGSGMDSGAGVSPAPSGGSDAATSPAPGTYPETGTSGAGTDGANTSGMGTSGNGTGTNGAGSSGMGAPGMQTYDSNTYVGPSARGVDPGVYPLISNDSLYPDPRAGMPTGAGSRKAW